MPDTISRERLVNMLRAAATLVRKNREELGRLDSFGGDGDHGATMARAMDRLEQAMTENGEASIPDLLQKIGWAIMGVDGGATGPLLGSFFMAMPGALEGDALRLADLARAMEAGLEGVKGNTRARPGDKTMIDALEPAVLALRVAANQGQDVITALDRAAAAAQEGAGKTRDMQARFGRARNLGEKSVGHEDPGATSISLIFRGFLEGARSNG